MLRFLIQRLGLALLSVWAVCTLTFFIAASAPGDPALVAAGAQCPNGAGSSSQGGRGDDISDGVCHGLAPRFNYMPSEELLARLTPEKRRILQPVSLPWCRAGY
jgi:ABC-type microcin C transport system permease subunit YejB